MLAANISGPQLAHAGCARYIEHLTHVCDGCVGDHARKEEKMRRAHRWAPWRPTTPTCMFSAVSSRRGKCAADPGAVVRSRAGKDSAEAARSVLSQSAAHACDPLRLAETTTPHLVTAEAPFLNVRIVTDPW